MTKLYKITFAQAKLSGMTHVYVVADNPTAAYQQVRDHMDEHVITEERFREMDEIKLLAELADGITVPACRHRLFLPEIFNDYAEKLSTAIHSLYNNLPLETVIRCRNIDGDIYEAIIKYREGGEYKVEDVSDGRRHIININEFVDVV